MKRIAMMIRVAGTIGLEDELTINFARLYEDETVSDEELEVEMAKTLAEYTKRVNEEED